MYCIFGKPVRHSLSPIIQNLAFNHYNLNKIYLSFEIDNISHGIDSIRNLNIQGASITTPFKDEVTKFIDEIDPLAHKINAVNTIKNINGRLFGYNTDGYGAMTAITKKGLLLSQEKILLLGTGAAARAIGVTLGANMAHITIAGRDDKKTADLASLCSVPGNIIDGTNINDLTTETIKKYSIIINATTMGLLDKEVSPIDTTIINKNQVIFDIIYGKTETLLNKTARDKKCRIIPGQEMLIYQGLKQFEIWTGLQAPEKKIYREIMKQTGK